MNGPFGNGFPYVNFHEMNMDWIIKIAKDFLDQYTTIQQTIDQGLEDLDTKATELQALLDAWYEEHSQDIADQLAQALEDLNTWYTQHEGYLDQYVTDSIAAFGTAADAKAAETIASIPDDYTAVANNALNATLALNGTKVFGKYDSVWIQGSWTVNGVLDESATNRLSTAIKFRTGETGYLKIVNKAQSTCKFWVSRFNESTGEYIEYVTAPTPHIDNFVCAYTESLYAVTLLFADNRTITDENAQDLLDCFDICVEPTNHPLQKILVKSSDWQLGARDISDGSFYDADNRITTYYFPAGKTGFLQVSMDKDILTWITKYTTSGTYVETLKGGNKRAFEAVEPDCVIAITARWANNAAITDKQALIDKITVLVDDQYITPYDYDSALTGKLWAVCGDSFSHGDFTGVEAVSDKLIMSGLCAGELAVYSRFIRNRTNIFVKMMAQNGMTLANSGGVNNFVDIYQTIPANADYITMYFGINDKIAQIPIGTDDSTDTATFKGAWNVVLTYLRNNHPFAHVGIIVSNSAGTNAAPYSEATRTMARKYGYQYLDLQSDVQLPLLLHENERNGLDSGIASLIVQQQSAAYAQSNQHPSKKTHEFESYMLESWLKTL